MKALKSMGELQLMKQKLEYQKKLHEKEITGSVADVVENLTDRLRDTLFQFGSHLVFQFFSKKQK
ncbi:hypothetical protein SAMN05444274_103278 [Mariniphaga anaerophila]|uniref:Uncharacterized protein n=1 Tax=Mariniphaga anaerophila TaxID=1484053 RepID=A0A1M4Y9B4_9BACT|nr:hypothetical protein [Mariniphaga anaerophila]SHF02219.1 hypothetical protein SAMN05444274_103278 [Mariniphaga anaerophila]